jgi:hypothetical protein
MNLATVDGAFVGEASPWRIEMRSIGSSLDRLPSISYCFVRIQAAVIAQW